MLKSEKIIEAMCLQEISHNALKDKMRKFAFGTMEVQDFINYGVETAYENHVKWALNLKTPDGWIPTAIREVGSVKKSAPKDVIKPNFKKGKEHGNYTNGNGARQRELWSEALQTEVKNGVIIRGVVESLGGPEALAEIIGCCTQTIYTLHVKRNKGTFIPLKYLTKIQEYCASNDIDLPIDELTAMIPIKN